jgi:hypothetical protein
MPFFLEYSNMVFGSMFFKFSSDRSVCLSEKRNRLFHPIFQSFLNFYGEKRLLQVLKILTLFHLFPHFYHFDEWTTVFETLMRTSDGENRKREP